MSAKIEWTVDMSISQRGIPVFIFASSAGFILKVAKIIRFTKTLTVDPKIIRECS